MKPVLTKQQLQAAEESLQGVLQDEIRQMAARSSLPPAKVKALHASSARFQNILIGMVASNCNVTQADGGRSDGRSDMGALSRAEELRLREDVWKLSMAVAAKRSQGFPAACERIRKRRRVSQEKLTAAPRHQPPSNIPEPEVPASHLDKLMRKMHRACTDVETAAQRLSATNDDFAEHAKITRARDATAARADDSARSSSSSQGSAPDSLMTKLRSFFS